MDRPARSSTSAYGPGHSSAAAMIAASSLTLLMLSCPGHTQRSGGGPEDPPLRRAPGPGPPPHGVGQTVSAVARTETTARARKAANQAPITMKAIAGIDWPEM